jgi:hypothetical protein
VADYRLAPILVLLITIVPQGLLILPQFPFILPDLGIIPLQRPLGIPRLLEILLIRTLIPGPARLVHFLALCLQLIRVPALGGAALF